MQNVINGIYGAFFQNLTKIAQRLGALPQTLIAIAGWGLRPQTPACDTFEYTSLLNTSPKLDSCIFLLLVLALSLHQNPG